jgi:ATP-dependent Clp protease adaptor protein ClpS
MSNNPLLWNDTETEEESATLEKEKTVDIHELILYNDDVNTFEFVTESLIKVCGHEALQAEQCTYLVHYKGKCSVKRGEYSKLEPMCTALLDRGLSAQIE